MVNENFSWKEMLILSNNDPDLKRLVNSVQLHSYEGFLDVLHADLEFAIEQLQDNRHLQQKSGEDLLTIQIISNLNCMNYVATHDTQNGGHVDLTVTKKGYRWMGEAKLWGGAQYCHGGYLQLLTRYSTGSHKEKYGGMILYFREPNVNLLMGRYKTYLEGQGHDNFTCDIDENNPLQLNSSQNHPTSGLEYKVKHFSVLLYFNPED